MRKQSMSAVLCLGLLALGCITLNINLPEEEAHQEETAENQMQMKPPAEQPPAEQVPQQAPAVELPRIDLAVTDLYADSLPHGQLFVRVTNNGPGSLLTAEITITCFANGKNWAETSNRDDQNITFVEVVQLMPGQAIALPTGLKLDANLYQYQPECSVASDWDDVPGNDRYSETIPN